MIEVALLQCGSQYCGRSILFYMNKKGDIIWSNKNFGPDLKKYLPVENDLITNGNPTPAKTLSKLIATSDELMYGGSGNFSNEELEDRLYNMLGEDNYNRLTNFNTYGWKDEIVTDEFFFTYYHSCPRNCGTWGVIYGDLTNDELIVGMDNLNYKYDWYFEKKYKDIPRFLEEWYFAFDNGYLDD